MNQFKPGDRYIHFTRYGGKNQGEVKWYGEVRCINHDLKLVYSLPYIVTTKNVRLDLDGRDGRIYKIEKDLVYKT